MTDEAIHHWLEAHGHLHPKEIGLRVGTAKTVLEELLVLRQAVKDMDEIRAAALAKFESSESPFYEGMKLLGKLPANWQVVARCTHPGS
jgi:hypothetical protein